MISALACGCLAGCKRAPAAGGAAEPASDPTLYLPPPKILAAVRGPSGLQLSGSAPAGAEVRLRSPTGEAFAATTGEGGDWSLGLSAAAEPRMFAVEAEDQGRILHAEGALLTLPPPGPAAVIARPGSGSRVVGASGPPLRLLTLDYDGAGGGAVSGAAAPRAPVRLILDSVPVASGFADDAGDFTLLDLDARYAFTPGVHDIRLEMRGKGRDAAVEGRWPVAPAPDLGPLVFIAGRQGRAFRVDWRLPGGGVQTTIVLDAPARGGET